MPDTFERVKVSDLLPGDLVDMAPVYVTFNETELGDYLVAECELAEVVGIWQTDGETGALVGFLNLGSWLLPADYLVSRLEKMRGTATLVEPAEGEE